MSTPDFRKDLAFSMQTSYLQLMDEYYKSFFGALNHIQIIRVENLEEQKRGYDVVVKQDNDVWHRIEEKRDRYGRTGNIVLELWSDINHKKGWLYTSRADYIAYHFDDTGITHLLPVPALRKAWKENEAEWRDTYRIVLKENRGWSTQFILIPLTVLWAAMKDVLVHDHAINHGERW